MTEEQDKTRGMRWPTLDEQFAEAKISPGSALEKLIRKNQDFDLLRPEEKTDHIGLPPWLRVYWRKHHPEGLYSDTDPTGGYPRVLKRILGWMLANQDFPRASSENGQVRAIPSVRKAGAREIVDGNLRISGTPGAPRSESDIRINFNDTNQIIAGANSDAPRGGGQSQYSSTDGGLTWFQTQLPIVQGDALLQSDPAVDWTSDGTAWAITIGLTFDSSGNLNSELRCYKSPNAGKTWTFESTPSGAQTNADRDSMWVDHSSTSPFKDNMYVIWHNGPPAFVARRSGIGAPWSAPLQVSGGETQDTAIGADIKTNSFGDVFAFWPDTGSRNLFVAKSTDGGTTFGKPVAFARTFGAFTIAVPADNFRQVGIYISGAAYRTTRKNLLYAAWTDLSGEPGCTSGSGPGGDVRSQCKTRIWFSRSVDGGSNWSPAAMINNQPSLNDQFFPRIAVDDIDGQLVIVYYDTIGSETRVKTDIWTQRSANDGLTWSPAIRVTTAETDETSAGADIPGAGFGFGDQYGDYIGLSGNRGIFFPSWTDRRSGGREEIWTAPLRLPGHLPWMSLLLR